MRTAAVRTLRLRGDDRAELLCRETKVALHEDVCGCREGRSVVAGRGG